jgi:hypothetical protein
MAERQNSSLLLLLFNIHPETAQLVFCFDRGRCLTRCETLIDRETFKAGKSKMNPEKLSSRFICRNLLSKYAIPSLSFKALGHQGHIVRLHSVVMIVSLYVISQL